MRERCKMIMGFAQICAKDEYFFEPKSLFANARERGPYG